MENLTFNRPAHKGYPGKVYVKHTDKWGICDPFYDLFSREDIELAKKFLEEWEKEESFKY